MWLKIRNKVFILQFHSINYRQIRNIIKIVKFDKKPKPGDLSVYSFFRVFA